MNPDTIFSGIMLFITTTMSILASALIAYLTFRRQNQKNLNAQTRLREINCNTALELFSALISNLMFFLPEGNPDFSREKLSLYCKKLGVIEEQLTDLTDFDLPDTFIPRFQYYRLKAALTKTVIEHRIEHCNSALLPRDSFDELEIDRLIDELDRFISANQRA